MLVIRLPKAIERKLEQVAKRTGKSKASIARRAIVEQIEDLEDIYLAERVLERIRSGKEHTVPLKTVMERLR